MAVTNNDCFNAIDGFQALQGMKVDDFNTSYHIALVIEEVQKRIDHIMERHRDIAEKYAEKDEDGNMVFTDETEQSVKIMEEHREDFRRDATELMEVEWEDHPIIFSSQLEGVRGIAPKTLVSLGGFLVKDTSGSSEIEKKIKAERKKQSRRDRNKEQLPDVVDGEVINEQ